MRVAARFALRVVPTGIVSALGSTRAKRRIDSLS